MAKDTQLTIRMDTALKEQAAAYAATQGRTLTNLIEWLLRQELKKHSAENRQEGRKNMNTVTNLSGKKIIFESALALMDDNIREILHSKLSPCSDQMFFTAYEKEYEKVYGERWELSKSNPIY